MNKNNALLHDSGIKYTSILTCAFLLIQVILVIFFYSKIPPVIPFFNSLPWGVERLSSALFIFAIPSAVFIILLINLYISLTIYKRHQLISRLLLVNVFLVALLGTLAMLQIFLLVF